MNFIILRRSIATALFACLLVFTGCLEDQENLITHPTEVSEQIAGPYLPIEEPVVFQYEQVSEEVIIKQFEQVAAAMANFDTKPESMSELLIMLGNDKANIQDFNLDATIAAYEQGLASIEDAPPGLVNAYLDEIFDIATSETFSPTEKYENLQKYKSEFINNVPIGLTSEEANAVLYDINLHASILNSPNIPNFGGEKALDILTFIVDILKILGLTAFSAADIVNSSDKCALAIFSLAWSMLSCASVLLGNPLGGFSCVQLPYKIWKVTQTCKKNPIVWTCEMSPDPCCGVNCIPGFTCSYIGVSVGTCVPDPDNDPCQDCGPGQRCFSGRCVDL